MESSVCVVIPAYQYGRYLGGCIESVLNQSRVPDEIIVVDDESTDNTKEVVSKYPVRYIWQKNKGLSGARNTGIKASTSDYIMCLDADDILTKNSIAEHLKLVDEMTIGQCALTWFGQETGTWYPSGANLDSLKITNSVFCNAMFSRKLWEKVGGFDESETMRLGWEDYEFWLRCAGAGAKFKTSNVVGLLYRKHGSNMTKMTTHPNIPKIKEYMRKKNAHLWD